MIDCEAAALVTISSFALYVLNRQWTWSLKRNYQERGEVSEIEFIPYRTELRSRIGNAQ